MHEVHDIVDFKNIDLSSVACSGILAPGERDFQKTTPQPKKKEEMSQIKSFIEKHPILTGVFLGTLFS